MSGGAPMRLDPRSSKAEVSIAYIGPAVEEGLMDVRDLAPALLALGALCEESNRLLNPGRAEVSVLMQAVKPGSFEVELQVWQQLITLISGADIRNAPAILTHLGFGFAGGAGAISVMKLWRRLKGRPAKGSTLKNGSVQINVSGDINVNVPPDVMKLYGSQKVQRDLRKFLRPLAGWGIDELQFKKGDEVVDSIDHVEAQEALHASRRETHWEDYEGTYRVVKPSFDSKYKWTFADDDMAFDARVVDGEFNERLAAGLIDFASGDELRIRVRRRTTQTGDSPRTTFTVLKVLDHRPATRRQGLQPGENGGE